MPNRIKEHRERLGLSQEKLATLTKTSTQQISRLERSERSLKDEWLVRLSHAMGVSKADLLSDAFVRPRRLPDPSNLVQDDVERTLLAFWRKLSPEAKDVIIGMTHVWADKMTRRRGSGT